MGPRPSFSTAERNARRQVPSASYTSSARGGDWTRSGRTSLGPCPGPPQPATSRTTRAAIRRIGLITRARASRFLEGRVAHAARDQEEDERGDHEAVDDEDGVVVPAHVAEQPLDGNQAAPGGCERADEERPAPTVGQLPEDDVGQALVEHGPEDDRDEEEEGEPRGRVAVEAQRAGHRDRDPRARDSGSERRSLRHADRDRLAEPEVGDLLLLRHPVGEPEEHAEDSEKERDLPRLAEMLLDDALAERARERSRDRRREHAPGRALLRAANPPVADAPEPGRDQRD